jgi:membrane protein
MLLYRVLPSVRLRASEVIPGALLAWALWVVAVWGYTIYLRSVPSFSITYGSLGGIIVTLFFFYISAMLFVFGAELNSVLRRRHQHREQVHGVAAPLPRARQRD